MRGHKAKSAFIVGQGATSAQPRRSFVVPNRPRPIVARDDKRTRTLPEPGFAMPIIYSAPTLFVKHSSTLATLPRTRRLPDPLLLSRLLMLPAHASRASCCPTALSDRRAATHSSRYHCTTPRRAPRPPRATRSSAGRPVPLTFSALRPPSGTSPAAVPCTSAPVTIVFQRLSPLPVPRRRPPARPCGRPLKQRHRAPERSLAQTEQPGFVSACSFSVGRGWSDLHWQHQPLRPDRFAATTIRLRSPHPARAG
jgi:hypothetical protein